MAANDSQVGGTHYASGYQHWDFIQDTGLDYLEAQVVKYVSRFKKKNGEGDILKAKHFLQKIEENRRKAIEETLKTYAHYNELDDMQIAAISYLLAGMLVECASVLEGILVTEYGYPDRNYVDQD